jgi:glycosyltransferase involved in cell wall biosynthesis
MKILFLCPYPFDEAPSQRFRFEQYLKKLDTNNISYSQHSFWDTKTWKVLYKPGQTRTKLVGLLYGTIKRFILLFKVNEYDFVFIHRECLPIGPPIVEWIIAKIWKKKIVFDFDDAIWLPDSFTENKFITFIKWHTKTSLICGWSYKVSCGNSFLADFARKYTLNVIVNPTVVDTVAAHNPSLHQVLKNSATITIGWTGTHSTLKYLYPLLPVMQILEKKHSNVRFLVIANKKPDLPLKSIDFIPWTKENEIKDLLLFDVGIMPLNDDPWSQGKCGFKIIQYMALAIPAVASPVGINTEIIEENVNGFLCKTSDQWLQRLSNLIEQPALRANIGMYGREKIIEHYSVVANKSTFLSLFQ